MTPVLVALVGIAIVAVVVLAIRSGSRSTNARTDLWSRFASAHGYRYVEPSGPWYRRSQGAIEGNLQDVPFRVDTYVVSTGKTTVVYTRVRSQLERPVHQSVRVTPRSIFTPVAELLGWKTQRTGHGVFDEKFAVRAKSRSTATAILDDEARMRLSRLGRRATVDVKGDEVKVVWVGAEKDTAVIQTAIETVAALHRAASRV